MCRRSLRLDRGTNIATPDGCFRRQRFLPGTHRTSPAPLSFGMTCGDEQEIRDAVDVAQRFGIDRLLGRKRHHRPLARRAIVRARWRWVGERGGRPQNEGFQRLEIRIQPIDLRSSQSTWAATMRKARSPASRPYAALRVGAEIEEIVLDAREHRIDFAPLRVEPPIPMVQLASSTVPNASMRASSLARRSPLTRPVLPSSPVRV